MNTLPLCFGHRMEVLSHMARLGYTLVEVSLVTSLVSRGPACLVCSGRLKKLDAESLRAL